MNAKALIEAYVDFPQEGQLKYQVRFSLIGLSGGGFLGVFNVDAEFLDTDSVAQIKTKIRNAIIAKALQEGHTVTTTNVGSIFQI